MIPSPAPPWPPNPCPAFGYAITIWMSDPASPGSGFGAPEQRPQETMDGGYVGQLEPHPNLSYPLYREL